jgi:hypothetical protein
MGAIAEFRILTHTANAEFGHSTGSTTDAKSFFATAVEPLKRNQYGGTFGGPVNDMNSPNVAQIQTSQPGRLVQFALKFLF